MYINLPTYFTLIRIVLTPFLLLIFYLPFNWAPFCCMIIFMFASLTDWFDGFLARKWNQKTDFGAFLDPVADKIMVTVILILITEHFHYWIITLPTVVVIIREILISALRTWMAITGKKKQISVLWVGKLKTTAQILALSILILRNNYIISIIGITALYISALLAVLSLLKYLNLIWHDLF